MSTINSDNSLVSLLIIADIEGSTGCLSRSDAQLFNDGWVRACVELTNDLNAIAAKLFDSGLVKRIRVKDFHRSGFNIFADRLDARVELSQGYEAAPVIGIGDCSGFDLLFLVGLHAASGSEGFLPHTLTSRFAAIKFNDRLLTEAELFAASVAGFGLKPAFFSGEETACRQVLKVMPWLKTSSVEKPLSEPVEFLRSKMQQQAILALKADQARLFAGNEAGKIEISFREGATAAARIARLWQLEQQHEKIVFAVDNLNQAYLRLIEIAYLTPFWAKRLRPGLKLFNLWGRLAHFWAKRRRNKLKL